MPLLPDDQAIMAVLDAFASDPSLGENYVLKGGNALKFGFHGIRASVDLDFSSVKSHPNLPASESEILLRTFCDRLDVALSQIAAQYGFPNIIVQKRKVLPPKKDPRLFPSFEINIGYTQRTNKPPPYSNIVKLDITLNDLVCESEYVEVGSLTLHLSSLDDIIAEKLRSLLQQVPRNRTRPSDVFDIWFYTTKARKALDSSLIARYLQEKSVDKEGLGEIRKQMFYAPEIRQRAQVDYDQIETRLPPNSGFPDFSSAFSQVLAFVEELDIP